MNCLLFFKKYLDLAEQLSYCVHIILLDRPLHALPFRGIIYLENTLQASSMVRRRNAQTGGFIILRGVYAL